MPKANNKTVPTADSVADFLGQIEDPKRKADVEQIAQWMEEISGEQPQMWGTSIVGFGTYHYIYDSGREGDFMKIGLSPRKKSITLYIMPGFEHYAELIEQLGEHKTGKSCLYINKLSDVDHDILKMLIRESYGYMTAKYG